MAMIMRLFLCPEDGEHHDMDAVKSHNNSRNNKEEANLKYKWVECMSGIFKSLEKNYRCQKHEEYGINQVGYTFN